MTLPQEQTRVLWVPARAARKHLIEIELEVEGYPFFLFFLQPLLFFYRHLTNMPPEKPHTYIHRRPTNLRSTIP